MFPYHDMISEDSQGIELGSMICDLSQNLRFYLRCTVEKRRKKASVDEKRLIRFQETEYGGFQKTH